MRESQSKTTSPLNRKPAFLSVDCDSQLDCFRTLNVAPRSDFKDLVYREGIPRLLDLFARVGARATFFLIGREASKPQNQSVVRRIIEEGHEVGNHSMTHPTNFTRYGLAAKSFELDRAHEAIAEATGQEPVGFRAPAYCVDQATFDLLEERGYLYDSSIIPSSFFSFQHGAILLKFFSRYTTTLVCNPLWHFAPKEPYHPDRKATWRRGQRRIWEVPLTVVPGLTLPFCGSFLIWAGMGYFKAALSVVARRYPFLVFQCRPLDLMTLGEDGVDPRLSHLPGLAKPTATKEQFIHSCLQRMNALYEFLPGKEFLLRAGYMQETT